MIIVSIKVNKNLPARAIDIISIAFTCGNPLNKAKAWLPNTYSINFGP